MLKNKTIAQSGIFFILTFFILNISCRKDLDFESSAGTTFRFSQDTVFLDTVFTQSNSETFLVKVFNDSDEDVLISSLYLNQKENSPFRINVDGRTGFEFNEVALRGKDSLMIFVEIALGESADWIAEDEIMFENQQQVKLLAAVEDAIYHFPHGDVSFSEISVDTQWDDNKAHIIYGNLKIAKDKKLDILPGTKIYFHQNSGLELGENATLNAMGTKDKRILFRSDRHTTRYDTLPKQWNEIKLMPNANLLADYIIIKGANNGLNLTDAYADLKNVEIYNAGSSGIFSKNSTIVGRNVVISDAGNASLNIENGGDYQFYFSTFANQSASGVVGVSGPAIPLYLSDYTDLDGTEANHPINAVFANSIFYGAYPNGVVVDLRNENNGNYTFDSCLIKNEDTESINYSTHPDFNQILTADPMFRSAIYSNQDLRLGEESPARNQGNPLYIDMAPTDINEIPRDNTPNLGAYE
ncbi:hypothetical protein GO491_03660 [Flavobacteriaceae bacterium Ap0902]|nr:hypothetical protein [Flavobacteriaceae bacterium Ap0902]